ncbi:GntR family transcriptional regulator [Parvibaculum sp.]|uniref:GntR family transcriptional regulator n=1 Tax=Parvibaculum sp. TaxID=2024848 RepID=UPI000C97274B|nr:GntR family transcriptional regulator [Parvibaculum sp.]MAB14020.1 hypothetical protein [Parvibaculum sp.]
MAASQEPPPGEDSRRTHAAEIADALEQEIGAGTIPPGTKLIEEALAKRFGVSRGPVREALRILSRDDLVRIRPHLGACVPELTPKELSDLYEVRTALFAAAIRLFTLRLHNGELSEESIARYATFGKDLWAAKDAPAEQFARLSQSAARFIYKHCGNPVLHRHAERIDRQAFLFYVRFAKQDMAHRQRFLTLSNMLGQAVRMGDADLAASLAQKLGEENRRTTYEQYRALKSTSEHPQKDEFTPPITE